MSTIHAVFERGVFRPTQHVDLPEHSEVTFEPRVVGSAAEEQRESLRFVDPDLAAVYEVLSRRHNSGRRNGLLRPSRRFWMCPSL